VPTRAEALQHGRIAVVDDEESIRESVGFALRRLGYAVETFADGETAWERLREALPDLCVLDILMPRMDGLELCRRLRSLSEELPIVFLTSRDEEFDRVLGLELGADDYLCKPFSMRELAARVKVLLRRLALLRERGGVAPGEEDLLHVDALELDQQRYTASWRGLAVALTVTEFLVLRALARHPGRVKTRRQLMEEGYPHDAYVSERTIDSHIKRIRRKLEAVDARFDRVQTVHGLGYRWGGS
jgi:two-component system, OmpR family, response regulator ChvI